MTSIWVYSSENHGSSLEVPLTPETLVSDVLDCVRDPVRGDSYLVSVAGDTEYQLQPEDNVWAFLYDMWTRTGSTLSFILRYKDTLTSWPPPGLQARRQQMRTPQGRDSHTAPSAQQLPGGDLTLAELQEMSTRQQQQMEAQQQVLVAKEQRLKYLRQHESLHAQRVAHNEQLRRATERVENQEMKLRKLRALRGQAEQYRHNNGQLTSELEAVRAVFNEKEKELAMAVARVDQLTRQLQELRNSSAHGGGNNKTAAALELEKLRNELLIRNKLNEQQTQAIAAKEKLLSQRREEVTRMDARIHELQQRLKKRRSQEQQSANQNTSKKQAVPAAPGSHSHHHGVGVGGPNVATVEPYIQYAPQDVVKDDSFTKTGGFLKQDPKYQTLPSHVKFVVPPGRASDSQQKQVEMNNNNQLIEEYPLPTVLPANAHNKMSQNHPAVVSGNNNNNESGKANFNYSKSMSGDASISSAGGNKQPNGQKPAPPVAVKPLGPASKQQHQQQLQQQQQLLQQQLLLQQQQQQQQNRTVKPSDKQSIMGVPSSANEHSSHARLTDSRRGGGGNNNSPRVPDLSPTQPGQSSSYPVISINEEERQAGSGQSSPASSEGSDSSGGIQVLDKDHEVNTSSIGPVSAMIEKLNQKTGPSGRPSHPSSSAAHPPQPAQQAHRQVNVAGPNNHHTANNSNSNVPPSSPSQTDLSSSSKPVNHDSNSSSRSPTVAPPTSQGGSTPPQQHAPHLNQKPAPTYRYASKNQIANTYMGRLGSAAMEKYQRNLNLLYRNQDALSGRDAQAGDRVDGHTPPGMTAAADVGPGGEGHPQFGAVASPNYPDIASDKGSYKLNTPKHIRRRHSDSENEDLNKALQERQELEQQRQQQTGEQQQDSKTVVPNAKTDTVQSSSSLSSNKAASQTHPDGNSKPEHNSTKDNKAEPKVPTAQQVEKKESQPVPSNKATEVVKRRTKSNLKKDGVRRSTNRVSFDPLALLLDASLEGELELVRKVAVQVDDVSTANDEGITALHNAICAGHYEIVKFLVEFGCDVNSPDSDGWTPLHCAASCNNLPMVRFLVEHGACVFATTISDQETAADKCEEEEDGYDSCSDYLYSIQEKLGITNSGEVYAVFDYQATNVDELSFVIGASLTVLRKGDEKEKEWWWARLYGKEGYIPRNLLGLYPRVIGQAKVSEC